MGSGWADKEWDEGLSVGTRGRTRGEGGEKERSKRGSEAGQCRVVDDDDI